MSTPPEGLCLMPLRDGSRCQGPDGHDGDCEPQESAAARAMYDVYLAVKDEHMGTHRDPECPTCHAVAYALGFERAFREVSER